MAPKPEVWGVDQLAAWLGRTPCAIRKAAQRGRLPVPYMTKRPYAWLASRWYRWAERA